LSANLLGKNICEICGLAPGAQVRSLNGPGLSAEVRLKRQVRAANMTDSLHQADRRSFKSHPRFTIINVKPKKITRLSWHEVRSNVGGEKIIA
jgi:hypothetical protein